MKPQRHSKVFSPSKSALWLNCYLSTIFADGNGNETSEQAEFGTECHELGSLQIAKALDIKDYDEEEKTAEEAIREFKHYSPEMQEIADKYTSFVVSTVEFETSRSKDKPIALLEQSVDLGFDENSVGTLDFGIISDRNGGTLTIIDLKTGRLPVHAFDKEENRINPQLGIYASAVYKCFKDVYPIRNVRLVIYQPVINNINEHELPIEELIRFDEEVVQPAVKAIKSGDRTAKENHKCKYCPGFAICRKKLDSAVNLADLDRKPETLTEEEIARILPKCDDCIAYFQAVKDHCLKKALGGYRYEGYKLVHSRVTRKISDEAKVGEILTEAGYEPYAQRKLLGITELTRKLGKDRFKELVSPYVVYQEGAISLVPVSDPREEIKTNNQEEKSNA